MLLCKVGLDIARGFAKIDHSYKSYWLNVIFTAAMDLRGEATSARKVRHLSRVSSWKPALAK